MRATAICLALSVSFIPAISSAQFFDSNAKASVERFRITDEVPYVSQKAHHAYWCVEMFQAYWEYQRVNTQGYKVDVKEKEYYDFWIGEIEKYNVTDRQIKAIAQQVMEFYRLDPAGWGIQNPFHYPHMALNCAVNAEDPASLYLYNTAKE